MSLATRIGIPAVAAALVLPFINCYTFRPNA